LAADCIADQLFDRLGDAGADDDPDPQDLTGADPCGADGRALDLTDVLADCDTDSPDRLGAVRGQR
jgi:hypothetical protein